MSDNLMDGSRCRGPELDAKTLEKVLSADPSFRDYVQSKVNRIDPCSTPLEDADFRTEAVMACQWLAGAVGYPPNLKPGTLFGMIRSRLLQLQSDSQSPREHVGLDLNERKNGDPRGGVRERECPRLVDGRWCMNALVLGRQMSADPEPYHAVEFRVPCPFVETSAGKTDL